MFLYFLQDLNGYAFDMFSPNCVIQDHLPHLACRLVHVDLCSLYRPACCHRSSKDSLKSRLMHVNGENLSSEILYIMHNKLFCQSNLLC